MQIITVIISISGLLLAGTQAYQTWKSNKLSVLPKLNFHHQKSTSIPGEMIGLFLENAGVGPARIKRFQIKDNESLVSDWDGVIRPREGRVFVQRKPYHNIFFDGDMIRAEKSVTLLSTLPEYANEGLLNKLIDRELDVEIIYCSIYDECYFTCWADEACKNKAILVDPPASQESHAVSDMIQNKVNNMLRSSTGVGSVADDQKLNASQIVRQNSSGMLLSQSDFATDNQGRGYNPVFGFGPEAQPHKKKQRPNNPDTDRSVGDGKQTPSSLPIEDSKTKSVGGGGEKLQPSYGNNSPSTGQGDGKCPPATPAKGIHVNSVGEGGEPIPRCK